LCLAHALPEAIEPAFIYLDAHPTNLPVNAGRVTAVVDFGGAAILGDRGLERSSPPPP
jgi:hypothetical protein